MKVLFIGNSHTYFNDMPQTFADMCREAGIDTDVTMLAYSWKDLEWHAAAEYFTVRFNILYGGYDYCVVQQAAHPFPGDETTLVNMQRIADLCEAAGTKPILIETWAERDHPEHQENLSHANRIIAEKTGSILAPVGTVWEKIRNDHPEIELFWRDGEHAGPYGDLIIAGILYRITTDKKMEQISFARDFAGDIKIDFHHPRVLEDKKKIVAEPDKQIVKIITEYVNCIRIQM
jgi:hypothetical protein